MDKVDVQHRYREILAEETELHGPAPTSGGAERRGAPRVSVVTGDMSVNLEIPVIPVNLSVSGACFFAERPFTLGAQIDVSIAAAFTLKATVVNCAMEESSSEFLEVHYRVHCKFADEDQGLELLVLAKNHEGDF
jgi:hypothetical protein